MSSNFRIACRFLTARKRSMAMSLSCTILGVGLFILTQATTGGFRDYFIHTILGADGAVRIADRIQATVSTQTTIIDGRQTQTGVRYVYGVEDPRPVLEMLRTVEGVSGAAGVLRNSVTIQHPFKNDTAEAFGIEVDDYLQVSNLSSQVSFGSVADFRGTRNGILIGRLMADRLALALESPVMLISQGQQRSFVVKGIFETGIADIDRVRVFAHMAEVRSLLRKPTGVSFIQINLADPARAPGLAERLTDVLGHMVTPWQVRNKDWLTAFNALGVSSMITVSVFTLIAGLAMFNTLAMIVLEKTKDIAILRSMGYEREDITRIFLWQAAIVLAIGALAGSFVGATGTFAISKIPLPITGIFQTDTFRVTWSLWHYIAAVLIAAVMVMTASLIPARRAARLEPGDIVRGTAQ